MITRRDLIGATSLLAAPAGVFGKSSKSFKLYDELYYVDQPNFQKFGLYPIHVAYAWNIWGERHFDGVRENKIPEKFILNYPKRYSLDPKAQGKIVLDIEHWPLYRNKKNKILENLKRYLDCLVLFKEVFPNAEVSLYNICPLPSHYHLARRELSRQERLNWMKDNDLVAPLVGAMDFVLLHAIYQRKCQCGTGFENPTHSLMSQIA